MFWFLPVLAAAPAPVLTGWATESEGRSQLVLTLALGPRARFHPSYVYRLDLLQKGRRVGRMSCRLTSSKHSPMRCRIEGHGAPFLLDLPLQQEQDGPGIRGFVGRLPSKRSRALVFLVDTTRLYGLEGVFEVHAVIETVQWRSDSAVDSATCEGLTEVLVEPEPWTHIEQISLHLNGQEHTLDASRRLAVPTSWLQRSIGITLDEVRCKLPHRPGATTGSCGAIGLALHFSPLCAVPPNRTPVASMASIQVDANAPTAIGPNRWLNSGP